MAGTAQSERGVDETGRKGVRLLWGFNGFCRGFVLVYDRTMIPDLTVSTKLCKLRFS